MAIIEESRRKLLATSFTSRKRRQVILQYEYTIPTVDPDEVVAQATPAAGCPGAPWEGALECLHGGKESDLI